MQVGDIAVLPVHDGTWRLAPGALFARSDDDWLAHRQFLDRDGKLPCEVGGFLVRAGSRLILVDAGAGPDSSGTGQFMASLDASGFRPDEVTDVVLTHLHFDHVGWTSDGSRVLFENATYRCDERDWTFFMGPGGYDESQALAAFGGLPAAERLAPVEGRLETWSGDVTIAPGVNLRAAPGHTPGSTIVVLSCHQQRAVLLGDVVHCPVQLLEDEWEMIGDVDRALAQRTREALAREFEGTGVAMAAAHFPDMRFGRLLLGQGRRSWVVD